MATPRNTRRWDMSRDRVIGGLAVVGMLAGALPAEEKKPGKVELRAEKGQVTEFVVKRSSSSDFGGQQRAEESEIEYRIEVAEKKEGGAVLKVTYASVKAKGERRDGPWEFDSAKKEGGDESAAAIREAIAKPITVEVQKGRVTDIVGLPEPQRPDGDGGQGFRGMRGTRIAGREALRRDLELILAAPIQGEALEKGKVYRLAREERPAAKDAPEGERKGRGGRFGRGGFGFGQVPLAYKFEADESAGSVPAAKFSLAAEPPEPREGGPRVESKSEGSATISLKDGLLLKLDLETSSSWEFERDGQTTRTSMKSKTSVARKEAKGGERTASRL
jgi:hypothetical protein